MVIHLAGDVIIGLWRLLAADFTSGQFQKFEHREKHVNRER
jgi:hypothetical protein